MARETKELSPLEVGRLSGVGYHHVGGVSGLVLQVSRSGTKSWLMRISVGGKRREIGLGGYPDTTLAGAREAARAVREKVKAGVDPIAEKRAARSALAAAIASALTFRQAAEKYIAANEAGWKNAKHAAQWTTTLQTYAYPSIGNLQVAHIETSHVVGILESIWAGKTETASRLRGRIEAVLDWAKVRGYRKEGENPARWKGHLDHILPPRRKVQRARHHPALDYRRIGEFMSALRAVEGMGARALEFAIFTSARSGEVRGATWSEIDHEAGIWIVPGERMKAGVEHRVPLSPAALAMLESMPRIAGTKLIFPNGKNTELSDMTLTAVIRRMHRGSIEEGGLGWLDNAGQVITGHGFRSTFRDWAGETTAYPREVIEHALAHQLADKAEAAYQRGDLLEKRRRLMADWGRYCTTPSTLASVAPIRGAA